LSVNVDYFFEDKTKPVNGLAENGQELLENSPSVDASVANNYPESDILTKRETLDLVRAWYKITDIKQRRKIFDLIRSLADGNA
jgi:hypothetical protein